MNTTMKTRARKALFLRDRISLKKSVSSVVLSTNCERQRFRCFFQIAKPTAPS